MTWVTSMKGLSPRSHPSIKCLATRNRVHDCEISKWRQREEPKNFPSGKKIGLCQGSGIRMKSNFSTGMLKAAGQWSYVFKIKKENDLQPILRQTNNEV